MEFQFDLQEENSIHSPIIKVIGVGGCGGNAVNHMIEKGIKGVEFVYCNLDKQHLDKSLADSKIFLGGLTAGNGAGTDPMVAKEAALQSIEDIKKVLSDNTKMIFITAGMGKGTGTGASPVIAQIAKELGILTVAIVTLPFKSEGMHKMQRAKEGVANLSQYVDGLMIIDNQKIVSIMKGLSMQKAFASANDVLATAAKGIAELITVPGMMNVDFEDVKTVMKQSGEILMGNAYASGPDRAVQVVKSVMDAPLLQNSNINGAKYILLNISYNENAENPLTIEEFDLIAELIQEETGYSAEIILGNTLDESLGEDIHVTLVATGFQTGALNKDLFEQKAQPTVFTQPIPQPIVEQPVQNIAQPQYPQPFIPSEPNRVYQNPIKEEVNPAYQTPQNKENPFSLIVDHNSRPEEQNRVVQPSMEFPEFVNTKPQDTNLRNDFPIQPTQPIAPVSEQTQQPVLSNQPYNPNPIRVNKEVESITIKSDGVEMELITVETPKQHGGGLFSNATSAPIQTDNEDLSLDSIRNKENLEEKEREPAYIRSAIHRQKVIAQLQQSAPSHTYVTNDSDNPIIENNPNPYFKADID